MKLNVQDEAVRADILIIGGGIAGLQAAIAAREAGADSVLVLEKADSRRSGNGATGNDHFFCYLPEIHGDDLEGVVDQALDTLEGPFQDRVMLEELLLKSHDMVDRWESYGIAMRPTGSYHFEGHTLPGRKKLFLKYDGTYQKPGLTKAALKRGARIRNHVSVIGLTKGDDGRVTGAVAIDISEDEPTLLRFEAKVVIVTTGGASRVYPNSTPAFPFNMGSCPACAGSAIQAYRIGARIINADMIGRWAGPRFFERSGKGTWIGVLSDSKGTPIGPYVSKGSREYGDPFSDVFPGVFYARLKNGTGPTYNDCRSLSDEDRAYMRHCFVTEGDTSINDYLDQRDIDLSKEMIEFGSYGLGLGLSGLDIDLRCRTSVPGLFAAGNSTGNVRGNISKAAVFGQIAGTEAARYASAVGYVENGVDDVYLQLGEQAQRFLSGGKGASWRELASSITNIMAEYVGGDVRTDSLLTAGLRYLRQLRKLALDELSASNSHELMRVFEELDVLDYAEVAALTARNRKETRGGHKRADYPFANVLLNDHYQVIERNRAGVVSMRFRRNIKRLSDGQRKTGRLPFVE